LRVDWGEQGKIVFIDRVRGETHHVLFPAFDLVLTRAGGGTVNDGLACGAPMVLVEEPGMWQVEQIRRTCIGMGFARGVSLKEFLERPRACVESTQGGLLLLEEERRRILDLPHHGEVPLVRVLLEKRRQACIG